MNYVTLGRTDLTVSQLGFGTARFAESFYDASRQGMVDLLRSAHDRGVTFFDTADMYAQGRSESLLGVAFGGRASEVVISSKVGYVVTAREKAVARAKAAAVPLLRRLRVPRPEHVPSMGPPPALPQNFSPVAIRAGLEGSLRRLKQDHLDLYLLHGLPEESGIDDAFGTLDVLKQEGKIRHFGASCEVLEHAQRALATPGVEVVQVTVNLLEGEALDVLREAAQQSTGTVVRQCFASGALARSDTASDPRHSTIEALRQVAAAHGRSLAELAFRYVADCPAVDVTLVGVRLPAHLDAAIAYADKPPLADVEWSALRDAGVSVI